MTRERGFRYPLHATGVRWRFKDRPVLVPFGLLALVVLVCSGMVAA